MNFHQASFNRRATHRFVTAAVFFLITHRVHDAFTSTLLGVNAIAYPFYKVLAQAEVATQMQAPQSLRLA